MHAEIRGDAGRLHVLMPQEASAMHVGPDAFVASVPLPWPSLLKGAAGDAILGPGFRVQRTA